MNSKSLLLRIGSGSVPVQAQPASGRPRPAVSLSVHGSAACVSHSESGTAPSTRISLHMEVSRRNIRRSSSEPNMVCSEMRALIKLGSRSFSTPRIPEVEDEERRSFAGDLRENGVSCEEQELGYPGGGMNKNGKSGGGRGGGSGSDADRHKIAAYYQEMIKSNPTNSLLLTNYGKYLYEVEGDAVKAEEYYGRALLASLGDGEVLSLYGKLIWETQRDESRAKSYFARAIQASPHDCMVLGSYAHFLWEAEEQNDREEDEKEMERGRYKDEQAPIAAVVGAY